MDFSIPHDTKDSSSESSQRIKSNIYIAYKYLLLHLCLPKLAALSTTQRQMDLRDLGLACTTEWIKGQPRQLQRETLSLSKSKQNKQQKNSRASTVLNIIHVPLCILVESKMLVTNSWSQQMNPKPLMKKIHLNNLSWSKVMFWPPFHGCVGEFLEFVFTHISQRIVGG